MRKLQYKIRKTEKCVMCIYLSSAKIEICPTHRELWVCLCLAYLYKVETRIHVLTCCKSWSLEVSVWNSKYGNNVFTCLYSCSAKNNILPYWQGAIIISSCNLQSRNAIVDVRVAYARKLDFLSNKYHMVTIVTANYNTIFCSYLRGPLDLNPW